MIPRMVRDSGPPRHQVPEIDAAALEAARAADLALAAARAIESERWTSYLERVPSRLRDDPVGSLRSVARLTRSAYGPKDSIREVLSEDVTEPLLKAIDKLLKTIARHEAQR